MDSSRGSRVEAWVGWWTLDGPKRHAVKIYVDADDMIVGAELYSPWGDRLLTWTAKGR
jgi:hypothetical protein